MGGNWSPAEIPTKYFHCIDKARRKLAPAYVQIDKWAMMVNALKCFKDVGDYDVPIWEWEARPVSTQTYANLKTMMSTEYSKLTEKDAVTARATGHVSANAAEEFSQVTEELDVELTEKHSKQIEVLIKANTEAIAKLIFALSKNKTLAATALAATT